MDNHAYSVTFFLSDFNWPRLFLFSRRRFIFLLTSELPGLDNDDAFGADAPIIQLQKPFFVCFRLSNSVQN